MAKEPKRVACYTHTDAVFGGWKPGYLEAYCEARAAACNAGRLADNLWSHYLGDKLTDAEDALAVRLSGLFDRLAYAHWRDAAYLWSEGENR